MVGYLMLAAAPTAARLNSIPRNMNVKYEIGPPMMHMIILVIPSDVLSRVIRMVPTMMPGTTATIPMHGANEIIMRTFAAISKF